MSIRRQTFRIVISTYNAILISPREKGNPAIYNNMYEPEGGYSSNRPVTEGKTLGADTVAQQVNLLSVMLACRVSMGLNSGCSPSAPAPCQHTWEGIRRWSKCLSLRHPHRRPKRSSGLLVSAWLTPSHCGHLGSKSADGKFFFFF